MSELMPLLGGTGNRLRWLRRGVQLAALVVFLWSFRRLECAQAGTDFTLPAGVEWWFRIDPLVQACAGLAARDWTWFAWPALALLVLALFAGRAFCGWICPLGTLLDVWARLTGPLRRRLRVPAAPAWARQGRVVVLVAVLAAAVAGWQLVGFADPFALLVRGLAAADAWLWSGGGTWAGGQIDPNGDVTRNGLASWVLPARVGGLSPAWPAVGILGLVFLLELAYRRGWCRFLCPLGGLYGLASWRSLLRRLPGKICAGCAGCRASCQLDAFAADGRLLTADCTLCLDCVADCDKAVAQVVVRAPKPAAAAVDPGRRAFLISCAGAAVLPLVATPLVSGGEVAADVLRPPGASADDDDFLARCVRCGACMKACPSTALHPDLFGAGLGGVYAPRLQPRLGACAYDCQACGQACPTGAIPQLTLADKQAARIGLAVVDRARCTPFATGEACNSCFVMCPLPENAISMVAQANGAEAPVVDAVRCTGCGQCELACPVVGAAAIQVRRIPAA